MARNGSGTYSRVANTPYVYNTVIDQVVVNAEMDDIATALTNSLAKNGETTPTANLPMGGFKLTGLAAGAANGDSLRYEQVVGVYAALAGSASQAFAASSLDIGHASDTTLTRVSAGTIAVEGVNVLTTATGAPIAGSVGSLIGMTTITSTNAAWTPNAATTKMIVCVVGGGSGGGATAAFNTGTAEGGHAGEIEWGVSTSVSGTYAATIGAGSAGGAGAGASSTQGGTSSFIGTGLSVSAVGGVPAFGGASVAAPFTSGFNGEACIGVGGLGSYGAAPGAAAANSGAGGGAAKNDSGSARNGAAGGSGVIFVWEYR